MEWPGRLASLILADRTREFGSDETHRYKFPAEPLESAVADADVRMVWHLLKMGINPDQKRTKRVNSSTGELEEEDSRQPTTPLRYVLFRESDNFLTRGAYQLLLLPVANGPVRSKAEQSDFMRGLEG